MSDTKEVKRKEIELIIERELISWGYGDDNISRRKCVAVDISDVLLANFKIEHKERK